MTLNPLKRTVKLSMLFQWYRVDFGKTDEDILNFLDPYLKHRPEWTTMRSRKKKLTIKYSKYDWDSNGRGLGGTEEVRNTPDSETQA